MSNNTQKAPTGEEVKNTIDKIKWSRERCSDFFRLAIYEAVQIYGVDAVTYVVKKMADDSFDLNPMKSAKGGQ